ncbi:MAG: hypothetical protein AAFU53_16055 [Cyanobacteria bacterium J06632_3]
MLFRLLCQLVLRVPVIALMGLLLAIDIVFMGLHWSHHLAAMPLDGRFNLERDRGFAELFQYGQTWLIALLLAGWRYSGEVCCWACGQLFLRCC